VRQAPDSHTARTISARLVWYLAVVCAGILAVAALLVALEADPDDRLVQWLEDAAASLAGPMDEAYEFTTEEGAPDHGKTALVNWGIAAAVYLFLGRLVARIIAP
jgi:hypothetical protein